ncbi:uronyl 2-sulfotransferase-like isoform X2 [Oculina patagonica]
MGVLSSFVHYRKRIFVFIVGVNVLFCCLWIYVSIQKKTLIKTGLDYDQLIGELLVPRRESDVRHGQGKFYNSPVGVKDQRQGELLALTEVNGSDVKKWQDKFYKSLDNVKERIAPSMKHALELYEYNQSQLNEANQFEFPSDDSRESINISSKNGFLQFLEIASCKPISPDVVLYNRVYKTGSESAGAIFRFVGSLMDYEYSRQTTEDFYDRGISEPYPMIIERKVKYTKQPLLFNAHFYFRNNLKIHRTHTYVNQIREPVARYISHYAYMRTQNRPVKRVNEMIRSGEFNETIEECFEKQGQGCKHNVMTRFFCGTEEFCRNDPQKALARAKENILSHYAVVGLLEYFHLTLQITQRRLPYFLPVVPIDPEDLRLNETKKKNSTSVSEEMIEKIKRANWADVELYEFVKQIFWKQAQACGLSVDQRLMK